MDVLNFTTRADRDRFDLDQPVDASTDRQSRHDVRRNVYRRVDATRVRDATRCVDSTSDDFQILHSASERDSWEMMNFLHSTCYECFYVTHGGDVPPPVDFPRLRSYVNVARKGARLPALRR